MSFEALDWIMFEIWRRPWRKHIWSRSNLPVGEKYKIPLSDYKWAHWVWGTTSDRDLALQGRTQISSKMPSSDNNSSAHSSSPGSPGRGSICTTMTQVTNEQKSRWGQRRGVVSYQGMEQERLQIDKWAAVGVYSLTTVLEVTSNWGKDIW